MSEDIRYKMQHLGDIFVDALSFVIDSAKKSAKVVVLTYDIGGFKKKKRQYLSRIGMRIVQVKKAGLADFNRDDTLVGLITDAEKIDRYIESCEEKKKKTPLGWQRNTGYADGAL
jgi:hypothetical protein